MVQYLDIVVGVSLAVDVLETLQHHQTNPQHGLEGPRIFAACSWRSLDQFVIPSSQTFEELVQICPQPVNDQEPQPDVLIDEGATAVEERDVDSADLSRPRPPVGSVVLHPEPVQDVHLREQRPVVVRLQLHHELGLFAAKLALATKVDISKPPRANSLAWRGIQL